MIASRTRERFGPPSNAGITLDDLMAHTRQEGDCLVWVHGCNKNGYGQIAVAGQKWVTHRLAWTLANGPIPDGLSVLHTCDNPPCINPAHLWLGTARDNIVDAIGKGRHPGPPARPGASNHNARLTEYEVLSIRWRKMMGHRSVDLAAAYGVTVENVKAIVTGRAWKHLGGPRTFGPRWSVAVDDDAGGVDA